jgi:thiol-disulfide isomerase/thioredoxin
VKGIAALAVVLSFASSQTPPPSAEQVLRQATVQAARENKNVLVFFSASWCSWCRRLDELLHHPQFAEPFSRSYVLTKIVVRERDELRATENPGWGPTMRRLREAPEQDVPFLAVLDSQGRTLAGSYKPEGEIPANAGFPRTSDEIEAFIDMIRRTGRGFSAEQRYFLKRHLRELAVAANSR